MDYFLGLLVPDTVMGHGGKNQDTGAKYPLKSLIIAYMLGFYHNILTSQSFVFILFLPSQVISPILKDLKWLTVRQQLYYRHAIMVTEVAYQPLYLLTMYIQRAMITRRTTRNFQMLNIPFYKKATRQRTFYFRTVKL